MPHSPTSRLFFSGYRFLFLRTGVWAISLCASATATSAQRTAAPAEGAAAVRLVSAQQGRKIAAAALERDAPHRGAQDCSHLVHQIYSFAGYEYPYASSFDLYAGNSNFRRVKHAQAGDVIAWPGHVGIVLDPKEHSFYSLVRSGLQAEDYLGPYCRSRGRPRFYRYVVSASSEVETAKAALPSPGGSESSLRRTSEGTTAGRNEAGPDEVGANGNPATEEASMREKIVAAKAPGSDVAAASIPSSILITPEQRRPTAGEAYDKIVEFSAAAANVLRTAEPLQVTTPIVIVDELRVEKIETKRDKGWIQLQLKSHARIADDGVDFKQRSEKARWELRRDESGWVAIAPTDRFYVTRDIAVRELAAQLAEMTRSEAAANHDESVIGQEARIANLLSALLEK